MSELSQFDNWFADTGPAALVLREYLIPVEGADGVFFPATYAPQQGADKDKDKFQGGYNIDEFHDGTNVCLIDSVGSQANRIEPIFTRQGLSDLVPQLFVTFTPKDAKEVKAPPLNLLHANHRAADAIFRCSAFEEELRTAFQEVNRGNAEKLAKLAPTSLVFGVWDSRDTQAKLPRLLSSTIRAFNVRRHTRSANFLTQMTIDLAKLDILPGADSKEGFANALASRAPGGIQLMPNGSVRRDATIALAALRRLAVREADGTLAEDRTKHLRRYILGLALVAITAPQDPYLRQGCNLVPDHDKPREWKVVNLDGSREPFTLSHDDAVKYAREAMKNFGIEREERKTAFDPLIADKAREAKPEKIKGAEVLSVDTVAQKFKVRANGTEHEIATTDETKFKKKNKAAAFEVVAVGAKLDLEVVNGVAVTVNTK